VKLKDFLIPTADNDFSPHLLQKTAFFLLCGLVMLSFVAVNVQTLLWSSSDWLVSTVLPAVVVEETNEARLKLQETALVRSAVLDEAAQLKAEHMAKNGYFAHYSPDGVSPWHWFSEVGYQYAHAGENLAVHFTDSRAVVDAWLDSPTHRANIVNDKYLEIGVGTAEGEFQGFKTLFVVQLFGTPAAPIQPVAVTVPPLAPVLPEPALALAAPEELSEVVELTDTIVLGETDVPVDPSPLALVPEKTSSGQKTVSTPESEAEADVISAPAAIPVLAPLPQPTSVSPEVVQDVPTDESFIATTSALAPIAPDLVTPDPAQTEVTTVAALATTPNTVLQILYLIIGTLVAVFLSLSVVLGMRYHRPWQVVYGVGLLMLMSGLFYLHSFLTSGIALAGSPIIFP
jgi:Cysteine-rich secretory protein family